MKQNHLILIVLAIVCLITPAVAQLKLPAPSPLAKATYTFGVTDISLEYSRPSLKGRKFGEGNLDYLGKFWRTGANSASTVTFSTDVMINGQNVPAGKYGLYTIPAKDEWAVIISKNTTVTDGEDYKQEDDIVRVKVKPRSSALTESLTIDVQNLRADAADIEIKWDTFTIPVTVSTKTEDLAIANINKELGKVWNSYAQAANYTLQSNSNLDKGKDWAMKSVALNEHYWNLHILSQFYAKENNFDEAVKTAQKANKLATEAKIDFFIGETEKNIKDWQTKTVDPKKKK